MRIVNSRSYQPMGVCCRFLSLTLIHIGPCNLYTQQQKTRMLLLILGTYCNDSYGQHKVYINFGTPKFHHKVRTTDTDSTWFRQLFTYSLWEFEPLSQYRKEKHHHGESGTCQSTSSSITNSISAGKLCTLHTNSDMSEYRNKVSEQKCLQGGKFIEIFCLFPYGYLIIVSIVHLF